MPIQSNYSDQQVETLLAELLAVLERHKTGTNLSLVVLGNMITHLINAQIAPSQRKMIAASFADALVKSINDGRAH